MWEAISMHAFLILWLSYLWLSTCSSRAPPIWQDQRKVSDSHVSVATLFFMYYCKSVVSCDNHFPGWKVVGVSDLLGLVATLLPFVFAFIVAVDLIIHNVLIKLCKLYPKAAKSCAEMREGFPLTSEDSCRQLHCSKSDEASSLVHSAAAVSLCLCLSHSLSIICKSFLSIVHDKVEQTEIFNWKTRYVILYRKMACLYHYYSTTIQCIIDNPITGVDSQSLNRTLQKQTTSRDVRIHTCICIP